MFKFLAIVVILAVAVSAYPAVDEVSVQPPSPLPLGGQPDLATKNPEVDLEGGEPAEGTDLKGSETFGFGYYPVAGYGRSYGYGGGYGGGWGYGSGYGRWGGYGGGWGYGGYPRRYYW